MGKFANKYKNMLQKKGARKLVVFAGFCHHPVTTTSAHTHAYHYPLFKSGTKQIREQLGNI